MRRLIILPAALLCATLAVANLTAQQPESNLDVLVRGNELFGRKLLLQTQLENQDKNVVVAPLPLTLTMAAFDTESRQDTTESEMASLFGWGRYPDVAVASRMLLAPFVPPSADHSVSGAAVWHHESYESYAWIRNTILFEPDRAGRNPFSDTFVWNGEKFFQLQFKRAPDLSPQNPGAQRHAFFHSELHAHMAWQGNTFRLTPPHQANFHTASGKVESVETQDSELNNYPYIRTNVYEAAVLPCYSGTMTVVLPLEGESIQDAERALVADLNNSGVTLTKRIGVITMPSFHFRVRYEMKPALEAMGIHEIFTNLGNIAKVHAWVTGVSESIDIAADHNGIRADAEAVTGMGVAGIMSAPDPFHLNLNRPFIFLIREHYTGALMFAGAVMNPAEQQEAVTETQPSLQSPPQSPR